MANKVGNGVAKTEDAAYCHRCSVEGIFYSHVATKWRIEWAFQSFLQSINY